MKVKEFAKLLKDTDADLIVYDYADLTDYPHKGRLDLYMSAFADEEIKAIEIDTDSVTRGICLYVDTCEGE